MTKLSQQLCDTSPDNDENSQIYSAPVAELGSTTNLCEKSTENGRNGDKARLSGGGGTSKQVQKQQKGQQPLSSSSNSVSGVGQEGQQMVASGNTRQSTKPSDDNDAGGYVTDEELELRHPTQSQPTSSRKLPPSSLPNSIKMEARPENLTASATSPSKEVLIGGDNNPSRRIKRPKAM